MKKIISMLALCFFTINAEALNVNPYLPSGHVVKQQRVVVIHEKNQSAKNIAIFAVGLGVMALIVGIKASQNNPGQIQIVRF
jgi:uncharacterized membrane protein